MEEDEEKKTLADRIRNLEDAFTYKTGASRRQLRLCGALLLLLLACCVALVVVLLHMAAQNNANAIDPCTAEFNVSSQAQFDHNQCQE